MKYYGYFGAMDKLAPRGGAIDVLTKSEMAERAMWERERINAPSFGQKCNVPTGHLMPDSGEALSLANYLLNGVSPAGSGDTLISRIEQLCAPMQSMADEIEATLTELKTEDISYRWMTKMVPRKYERVVSTYERAIPDAEEALAIFDNAIKTLKGVASSAKYVLTNTGTGLPWTRETVLRWCDNPLSFIPMERDICSDYRTRREMLRGRKIGQYRRWTDSCDKMRQYHRATGVTDARFDWPRPLDEAGCESGSETWLGPSAGCKIPTAMKSRGMSVELDEAGCYITETDCWNKYYWERNLASQYKAIEMLRRISDDDTGLFTELDEAIIVSCESMQTANKALSNALAALYEMLNRKVVKNTIIALTAAGTGLVIGAPITAPVVKASYNAALKKIKKARDEVRKMDNDLHDKLYYLNPDSWPRQKESLWDTSGGRTSHYTRRYGGEGTSEYWKLAQEYVCDDIMFLLLRMAGETASLEGKCNTVYPTRTTEEWKDIGVEQTCIIPISTYVPTGYGPGEMIPHFPKGGGSGGGSIPGGLPGGAPMKAGMYGSTDATQLPPEKHFGLTKNQWLLVGAAGAALYYFKGKK